MKNALQIITAAIAEKPADFETMVRGRMAQDAETAEGKSVSVVRACMASYGACGRILHAMANDNVDALAYDMAAGIIALNIACKLQEIAPSQRTSAALAAWGN